jgi:sialidase-1
VDAPVDLYRSGGWYQSVRIPSLAILDDDRLIALAVGRHLRSDHGPSDILIRRSQDGGATWSRARVLVRGWLRTVDNPTLVVDPSTEAVHLFYQSAYRRLWHRVSTDGGLSFAPPVERTDVVTRASIDGFQITDMAPGPGGGAVLDSGRLVIPIWVVDEQRRRRPAAMTIYSDDAGATWSAGDLVAGSGGRFGNPTETTVAAAPAGGAVLSFRQSRVPHRVFSWSPDGSTRWTAPEPAAQLFEPVSHAALLRVGDSLAFVNPDSRASTTLERRSGKAPRENLTLRWSSDDGRTWDGGTVIDPGPSGYPALAAGPSGDVHILWEHAALGGDAFLPDTIRYSVIRASR